MSLLITLNGANYIIPQTNEVGWGSNLDDYFVAIPAGVLQKTGGTFTLSAETDFGTSFGLKSLYYKSRSSNISATGIVRLANNSDAISWRNAGNSADLALTVNASNQLTFNGTPIESNSLTSAHILVGNGSNIATDVAMSGNIAIDNTGATTIQAGVVVNSMVNASAAIAYSKLNLTGGIVNADVNASAAIAYSKLTLTGSIVNADVNASAAIAYSKLTLTGSIVNADISASAAIAYSKLALTGSVVNADISSSAAIAITKVAIGTANQIIGTNAGATANEFKTLTATANQVSVTHGAGTVTFATPQDIGTASAVRFGSLTLGGALDGSSILSLTSTSKGFLPPVMTTTQKNAISTPTDGLIVYDSSLAQLFLRAASAWTPLSVGGGSGTVGSGTAGRLTLYGATGTTVTDTYVQNSQNINVAIAAHAALASTRTYTIPESGADASFVMSAGAQTILGTKTFGAGGTGVTNSIAIIDGGSGTAAGAQLRFSRNSVLKGTVGHYASIFGGTSDNLAIYSPSNSVVIDSGGTDVATFASTGTTFTGTSTTPNLVVSGTTGNTIVANTNGLVFDAANKRLGIQLTAPNDAIEVLAGNNITIGQSVTNGTTIGSFRFGTGLLNDRYAQIQGVRGIDAAHIDLRFFTFNSDGEGAAERFRIVTTGQSQFFALGAVSTPDISWLVDPDSGMYRIGANNIAFATNGVKAFEITATQNTAFNGNVSFNTTSTMGIVGTTTNDSAAAGNVGETVLGNQTTFTNFPTSTQWGDLTSISLSAGDWLVWGTYQLLGNGGTTTEFSIAVTTTTGNSTTGFTNGLNNFSYRAASLTGTNEGQLTVSAVRFSLSSPATVYLKYEATWSTTAPQAAGNIRALRIR